MKSTGLRGVLCGSLAAAACALLAAPGNAATGHPDFTGVWTNAGAPGIGGATRTAPAPLPFKPEAQARVNAFDALMKPTGDSPGGWCLGYGMPGSMLNSGGYPMEIIQRDEQLTVLYEAHGEMRHIYLGKRNAPEADRIPGRNGYSSAHWEGKTLVVETDNLVDQVDQRYAHSDEAKIVERYHLDPPDAQGRRVLVADMVMTDPKFYTEPVKAQKKWAEVPNGRLLPYECAEEVWTHHLEEMAKKAGVPVPLIREPKIPTGATRMKSIFLAAGTAALLAVATGAQAHHSAVQFDFTRQVPITGVVKQFRAINPHMQLTLEVADAKGTHEVEFEGHSTNNMYRGGYRKGMINAGDKITVNVAPPRSGGEGGYVVSAVTAKGEFFGMRSTRAADAAKAQAAAEGR